MTFQALARAPWRRSRPVRTWPLALAIAALAGTGCGRPDFDPERPGPSASDASTAIPPVVTSDAGSSSGGDTSARSGSRLHVVMLVGEDGSQQPNGWHDTEFGIDCIPLPVDNGTTRCLPSTTGTLVFSESSCTHRAALQIPCAVPAPYLTVGSARSDACGGYRWRVYPAGAISSAASYWQRVGETCAQSPVPAGYQLLELGPEVDPAEFVRLDRR